MEVRRKESNVFHTKGVERGFFARTQAVWVFLYGEAVGSPDGIECHVPVHDVATPRPNSSRTR